MTDIEEIRGQIDRVEASIEKRPGDAQAELEALMVGIGKLIAERQTNAQQLLRNEDFVGAAHLLIENGLLLQRSASLLLELREQVRRRR